LQGKLRAATKDPNATATVAPKVPWHHGIDEAIFHGPHPAFPFLLPGKSKPMQPKTKNLFNRDCFRFIYASTVNITKKDDPNYFRNLFALQCIVGDDHKCGKWSEELLQAVRKKMGAVKLLGKDGHIGRSKQSSKDKEFEAHLSPTMTGITSYVNWCNGVYKDLAPAKNESATSSVTKPSVNTSVTTKATTNTTKASESSTHTTKAAKKPVTKVAKVVTTTTTTTTTTKPVPVVTMAAKAAKDPVAQKKAAKEKVAPAKAAKTPVVPAKAAAIKQEKDGCFCFHRGTKKICECEDPKPQKQGSSKETPDKASEMPSVDAIAKVANEVVAKSESAPIKDTATQLRGMAIADQMEEASSKENDKSMDDVEKMMKKAMQAAESRAHKKKADLKKKA